MLVLRDIPGEMGLLVVLVWFETTTSCTLSYRQDISWTCYTVGCVVFDSCSRDVCSSISIYMSIENNGERYV